MTTAGRGPPQNLTTVSHFSVFRAFRRGETLEKRSGPLILSNVHTFGHPTLHFDECFTLLDTLSLILTNVPHFSTFGCHYALVASYLWVAWGGWVDWILMCLALFPAKKKGCPKVGKIRQNRGSGVQKCETFVKIEGRVSKSVKQSSKSGVHCPKVLKHSSESGVQCPKV